MHDPRLRERPPDQPTVEVVERHFVGEDFGSDAGGAYPRQVVPSEGSKVDVGGPSHELTTRNRSASVARGSRDGRDDTECEVRQLTGRADARMTTENPFDQRTATAWHTQDEDRCAMATLDRAGRCNRRFSSGCSRVCRDDPVDSGHIVANVILQVFAPDPRSPLQVLEGPFVLTEILVFLGQCIVQGDLAGPAGATLRKPRLQFIRMVAVRALCPQLGAVEIGLVVPGLQTNHPIVVLLRPPRCPP